MKQREMYPQQWLTACSVAGIIGTVHMRTRAGPPRNQNPVFHMASQGVSYCCTTAVRPEIIV